MLEDGQRIGRIRLATQRMPCVWLWSVTIRLTGGLPMGSSQDLDTAKAELKAAWEALKARTPPEQLVAAYKKTLPTRRRCLQEDNEHPGRLKPSVSKPGRRLMPTMFHR